MRVRSFVLGGTIALASALPASAGNFNGWYIGLEGGGNWNSDNDATFATVPPLSRAGQRRPRVRHRLGRARHDGLRVPEQRVAGRRRVRVSP